MQTGTYLPAPNSAYMFGERLGTAGVRWSTGILALYAAGYYVEWIQCLRILAIDFSEKELAASTLLYGWFFVESVVAPELRIACSSLPETLCPIFDLLATIGDYMRTMLVAPPIGCTHDKVCREAEAILERPYTEPERARDQALAILLDDWLDAITPERDVVVETYLRKQHHITRLVSRTIADKMIDAACVDLRRQGIPVGDIHLNPRSVKTFVRAIDACDLDINEVSEYLDIQRKLLVALSDASTPRLISVIEDLRKNTGHLAKTDVARGH